MTAPSQIHKDRAHSLFSASKAWLWAGYPGEPGCPGSVILTAKLPPEIAGPAADEGTECHELLERALNEQAKPYISGFQEWRLEPKPAEMKSAVNTVLQYLETLVNRHPRLEIYSELQLDFTDDIGGKFDIHAWCPDMLWTYDIDFKFGKQPVYVDNNPQLLSYAAFARKHFQHRAMVHNLVIIQPRSYLLKPGESPVKEWAASPSQVEAWGQQLLRAREEARQEPPVFRPRADRCRRCRATAICPAVAPMPVELPVALEVPKAPRKKPGQPKEAAPPPFLKDRATGEKVVWSSMTLQPSALLPDPCVPAKIAEALDGLPALKAYIKAVEELRNEFMLVHGLEVPRYKVVMAADSIEWADEPVEIAKQLWELAGLSSARTMPPKLISITAAKEIFNEALGKMGLEPEAKKELQEKFSELTRRVPSQKLEIVSIADPRPPASALKFDDEAFAGAEELT
jgi:hypothetical protein